MRRFVWLCAVVLVLALPAMAQDHPRFEAMGGWSYLHVNPGQGAKSFNAWGGWIGDAAFNANKWFGVAADISGHYTTVEGESVRAHNFLFGPRFTNRDNEHFQPFAHFLFGVTHISTSDSGSDSAFAFAAGGGVDVKIADRIALRLVQAEYLQTRFASAKQHNARISVGIVFHFGGK
jgi:opacity protein-like surface antigen